MSGCEGHVKVPRNRNQDAGRVTARLPLRRRRIPVKGWWEQASRPRGDVGQHFVMWESERGRRKGFNCVAGVSKNDKTCS